jgi:hypothetical protein
MPRLEEGVARKFIEGADRHLAESGERFTALQLELQLQELRHDVAHAAPDDARHAWRARGWQPGIPPAALADLTEGQIAELRDRTIAEDIERDRALLAGVPSNPGIAPSHRQRRLAQRALSADDLKRHVAEQRQERRQQPAHGRAEQRSPRARRDRNRK